MSASSSTRPSRSCGADCEHNPTLTLIASLPMKLDPDDPILTAYALGELSESECSTVEAELEHSPETRRVVEEIRQTANFLTEGLAKEPFVRLTAEHREL